jgi:hypothetical protein
VQLDESGALLLVGFASHIDGYTASGNISRSLELSIPRTSSQCCLFNTDERMLSVASWDKGPKITALDLIEQPGPFSVRVLTLTNHQVFPQLCASDLVIRSEPIQKLRGDLDREELGPFIGQGER